MKHLNESELNEALALHAAWQADPTSGRRLELNGVDLSGSDLHDAKIHRAVLTNVDLRTANLRGASFYESEIQATNLAGAILDGADFAGTSIDGTSFERCNGERVSFANARVSRATFNGAKLEAANFAKSDFRLSSMRDVLLRNAHLLRWSWTGGTLNGSNFSSSDLTSARFRDADLRNVDLTDTVLFRTGFTNVQFGGARGLPLLAEGIGAAQLDFSVEGDGTLPGNVDTLRKLLGSASSEETTWGAATMLELYQALQVNGGPEGQLFLIERRSDRRELISIEKYDVADDVLEVGYRLLDQRLYHPGVPERLIFALVIAELTQHEHKSRVDEIEYTNLANDYRTYQSYA